MPPTHSLYRTMLGRALRLRCPRCGEGILFLGWFHMRSRCDWCGLIYEREPGFFLGSIYVNYGLTAMLTTVAYVGLIAVDAGSPEGILWLLAAFCVLFPAWFFRYARSLWLGFDQYWDPRAEDQD
jgi:ribosomal protein S27AE